MSPLRHAGLGAFWLGTYFVIAPVYTVLLQVQVHRVVHQNLAIAVGVATGAAGLLAMLVPPLVGRFSDQFHSRWGRRRPVIVAGGLATVVALFALKSAHTYPAILVSFVALVALLNMAGAAYVALIPDTVHAEETGRASGVWGAFFQAGSALGLLGTFWFASSRMIGNAYYLLAAVLLLTLAVSLIAMGGRDVTRPVARTPTNLRVLVAPLWKGDFAWAFFTRLLTTAGFFSTLPFLLLLFGQLEQIRRPVTFTLEFELLVTATAIPVAVFFGWLSDHHGRKRFVYGSGGLACLVLLVILLAPRLDANFLLLLGAAYGVSYGAFTAVDWALALDTLPDRANPAKDLGLFHVADALPRVFVPFVAGGVVDIFNSFGGGAGYRAILVLAVAFYLFGTVFVSRIRSVS